MIRELKRLGVESVVDTEGEPLHLAVKAEPSVVTPNLVEAEGIVGYEFSEDQDAAQAVCEIVNLGPTEAVVTTPNGCVARILDNGAPRLVKATVTEQEVRSATGSGDAFLAGFVAARYAGSTPMDCIRRAVAAGAESTQHFGAGIVDPAAVGRMVDEVEVKDIQVTTSV
jgi:1-phosphofructokinase/tagatose 6-phosphate kinase